jgi:ribosomal 50S subunit-recycling heat shock protein
MRQTTPSASFSCGGEMRLDKFLKVSRIIKRRTVANDACDTERIAVNGRVVKASYQVKVDDVIEVSFGGRTLKVKVKDVREQVGKNDASELYEVVDE